MVVDRFSPESSVAVPGGKRSLPYPHHEAFTVAIWATAADVFAFVDDQLRLSSHMSQSSWKMGGGKMNIEFDELGGKSIGSKIRLSGKMLGITLWVEEIVTDRAPPFRKTWETIGRPRLLVIGSYRMGFEITASATGSLLRVFIDYHLPQTILAHWLGRLFGQYYARWCTRQMANDAASHFSLVSKNSR